MAIIGLGMDLIEITRIEKVFLRFKSQFIHKILTPIEQDLYKKKPSISSLAARFAAKEAATKALGTGFSEGITFKSIEVISQPNGKPTICLHGNAQKKATHFGVSNILLTLTHTQTTAGAVVILEA